MGTAGAAVAVAIMGEHRGPLREPGGRETAERRREGTTGRVWGRDHRSV